MPASIAAATVSTATACVMPVRVMPASGQQPKPSGLTLTEVVPIGRGVRFIVDVLRVRASGKGL